MMVYLAGNTFQRIISNEIKDLGIIVLNKEISNEIDFLKYVKQSITALDTVEILLIDICSCINNDDEIISALEMLRTMYDDMRIIIFAPYRATGDDFLTRCFNLGILNIINTDDFVEIKQELQQCILKGKSFKDAVKYKDTQKEKVIVKHEVKKDVNKKLIAVMGTDGNIGVTHNGIVLANFFRKRGYMVALAEMNQSRDFEKIRMDFDETEYEEGYFTLYGIDYFGACDMEKLVAIMEHPYNFIILDFGDFEKVDNLILEKCDEKIIISGSRPWEFCQAGRLFAKYADKENALRKLLFYFNWTPKEDYGEIKKGMGDLKGNVHFLNYTDNPFESSEFADAEEVFAEYLPEKEEEPKKKFTVFRRRKE